MSELRTLLGDDEHITAAFARDDASLDRFDAERQKLAEVLDLACHLPGERRRLIDVVVEILSAHPEGIAPKHVLNELNRDGGSYPCAGSAITVESDQLEACVLAHQAHRQAAQNPSARPSAPSTRAQRHSRTHPPRRLNPPAPTIQPSPGTTEHLSA